MLLVRAGCDGPREAATLTALAQALVQRGMASRLVAVDPAASLRDPLTRIGAIVVGSLNRWEWLDLCRSSHFVVASSLRDDSRRMTIEAMGHGCIPVLVGSDPGGESPVRDGDSGILAPDGAWEIAADRMCLLASDPEAQTRMATHAHGSARTVGYHAGESVDAYLPLLQGLVAAASAGLSPRPKGPILPPPAEVDGIGIFGDELKHRTKLGCFPSPDDAARFLEEAGDFTDAGHRSFPWQ